MFWDSVSFTFAFYTFCLGSSSCSTTLADLLPNDITNDIADEAVAVVGAMYIQPYGSKEPTEYMHSIIVDAVILATGGFSSVLSFTIMLSSQLAGHLYFPALFLKSPALLFRARLSIISPH